MASQKPSMDDILASIKSSVEEGAQDDGAAEDVLDLTEALPPEDSAAEPAEKADAPVAEGAEEELVDLDAFAAEAGVATADAPVSAEDIADPAALQAADPAGVEEAPEVVATVEQGGEIPAEESAENAEILEESTETMSEEVADPAAEETPAAESSSDIDDIDALMAEVAAEDTPKEESPTEETSLEEAPIENIAEEVVAEEAVEEASVVENDAQEAPMPVEAVEQSVDEDEVAETETEITTETDIADNVVAAEAETEASAEASEIVAEEVSATELNGHAAPATEQVTEQVTAAAVETMQLRAIPGPTGLQVGLPAEVLAEALRPLVSEWVQHNLPDVVERLVREELTRLAQD